MANYNFKQDIQIGKKGENVVANYLETLGATLISENNDNKFDIIMEYKGKQINYEIKTDIFCNPVNDTGNIFIEYECRNKPSGISVTKADWFVTYFKYFDEIWFIKTADLKNLISENEIPKTHNSGDSGSNTKGYLLNRYMYKKHFIVKDYK